MDPTVGRGYFGNEEGLENSYRVSRSFGFDGKRCIHPAQIGIVNEIFYPTEKEVEWARKVVEANEAGSGAIIVDGQMVDAASIRMARNTMGKSEAKEQILK